MSDPYVVGTITVSLKVRDSDTVVGITLPREELSVVQMLGMLELARDAILNPEADDEDNEVDEDE